MTMLERAVAHMKSHPDQWFWSLNDLRRATHIAIRSQHRLAEQLRSDARVGYEGGNLYWIREEA